MAKPKPSIRLKVTPTVGERKNYNLQDYIQWSVATIEWITTENRYRARVGFSGPEGQLFFFNSYHQDFADAEHTINFVKEGKASGNLYNIYGETISVSTQYIDPTRPSVVVVEVLSLIYSFDII